MYPIPFPQEGFPFPADLNLLPAACYVQRAMSHFAHSYEMAGAPFSPSCWRGFLDHCGLASIPAPVAGLDAVTIHHARLGWVVLFDGEAGAGRQCQMLCHELSEFLLATLEIDDDAADFRPPNMPVSEWRHIVSEEVVRIVFASPSANQS